MIQAVVATVVQPDLRPQLDPHLDEMSQRGRGDLAAALRRVLDGDCDPDALCADLDPEDTLIVQTVLFGIDDPEALQALNAPNDDATQSAVSAEIARLPSTLGGSEAASPATGISVYSFFSRNSPGIPGAGRGRPGG